MFPPVMWAGLEGRTTNNGAEAFHRHFCDLFGYLKSKPVIWHFLRNVEKFNNIKDVKIKSTRPLPADEDSVREVILSYQRKKNHRYNPPQKTIFGKPT